MLLRVPLWLNGMIKYFQVMIKRKNPPHSVLHLNPNDYPQEKILRSRFSFKVNITDIDNQYDLYSITCADGSSMLEGIDFTVS